MIDIDLRPSALALVRQLTNEGQHVEAKHIYDELVVRPTQERRNG